MTIYFKSKLYTEHVKEPDQTAFRIESQPNINDRSGTFSWDYQKRQTGLAAERVLHVQEDKFLKKNRAEWAKIYRRNETQCVYGGGRMSVRAC